MFDTNKPIVSASQCLRLSSPPTRLLLTQSEKQRGREACTAHNDGTAHDAQYSTAYSIPHRTAEGRHGAWGKGESWETAGGVRKVSGTTVRALAGQRRAEERGKQGLGGARQ